MSDILRPQAAITSIPGTCHHPVAYTDADGQRRYRPCGANATGWTVDLTSWGRGHVSRCYCVDHGGSELAVSEISRDWNYLAPVSVGDAGAVQDAGMRCLNSTNAYVVVREEHGRWLAYLGVGSMMIQVRMRHEPVVRRGRVYRQSNGKLRGQMATDSRDDALARAIDAWRSKLADDIAAITAARGGVLDWGLPVEPLADPMVLDTTSGNGWDKAASAARQARPGLAYFLGVRPSGEAP
jgi:hypothetical protein